MITSVSKFANLFRNETIKLSIGAIVRKSVKSNKIGVIPKNKKTTRPKAGGYKLVI